MNLKKFRKIKERLKKYEEFRRNTTDVKKRHIYDLKIKIEKIKIQIEQSN
ncbi:hypothetical protein [Flavobacterium sp. U410]